MKILKQYLLLTVTLLFFTGCATSLNRTEIGQLAYVHVEELNISYLSRIDSGARITSLHALNIQLIDENNHVIYSPKSKSANNIKNEHYKNNVGKTISFETINEKGQKKTYKAKVEEVSLVRNAQGKEYRYIIKLTLQYKGVVKYVSVNLRDRTKMSYKLLIGRNWLNDDFYVLTDLKTLE